MPDIPTLTTATDAETLLRELALSNDWVSVFWDKRDRRTPEISIIVDGDGQQPEAHITGEVYAALVDSGVVGEDTYAGFHARRLHDFKTPPVPEKTGSDSNDVIEEQLRALFTDHQDLPLRTAFFRGINKGNVWNPINEEVLTTAEYKRADRYGRGHVNISPGDSGAHISAWEAGPFGSKVSGVDFQYPRGEDQRPDLEAMRSPEFRADLLAAIRGQLDAVKAAQD